MIQDIMPLKFDNTNQPNTIPTADSRIFCFRNREVLSSENNMHIFPYWKDLSNPENVTYLFSVGEEKFFLLDSIDEIPKRFSFQDIKKLRRSSILTAADAFSLFTAFHLNSWYNANRICGSCGGALSQISEERALKCEICGKLIYPRIDPAVIVGVINGDSILVTRYADNRGIGYDALIGGYTEIGETFEDTVRREVMEEAGLKVKNIRYYKSQPWGMSSTILAGFFCDVDGCTNISIDETELSSAKWIKREDIVGQPDDFSLTHEMMMLFKTQDNTAQRVCSVVSNQNS